MAAAVRAHLARHEEDGAASEVDGGEAASKGSLSTLLPTPAHPSAPAPFQLSPLLLVMLLLGLAATAVLWVVTREWVAVVRECAGAARALAASLQQVAAAVQAQQQEGRQGMGAGAGGPGSCEHGGQQLLAEAMEALAALTQHHQQLQQQQQQGLQHPANG